MQEILSMLSNNRIIMERVFFCFVPKFIYCYFNPARDRNNEKNFFFRIFSLFFLVRCVSGIFYALFFFRLNFRKNRGKMESEAASSWHPLKIAKIYEIWNNNIYRKFTKKYVQKLIFVLLYSLGKIKIWIYQFF